MMLLDVTVRSSIDELRTIAAHVDEVADRQQWSQRAIFALQVSLDEWISNIIKYSYDGAADRPIRIQLDIQNNSIVANVEDEGRPFDPTMARVPDALEDTLSGQREGGMGLFMMQHLLSGLDYRHEAGRNIVRLWVEK